MKTYTPWLTSICWNIIWFILDKTNTKGQLDLSVRGVCLISVAHVSLHNRHYYFAFSGEPRQAQSECYACLGKVHLIWQGGGWRYWGGAPKIFRHPKGVSEKIVALGGGAPKICILQNQHMTSYRSDGFQLNNLMTCATQLYHVVYRYNKCSLSNYYTLVHPKNALENCISSLS